MVIVGGLLLIGAYFFLSALVDFIAWVLSRGVKGKV